MSQQIRWGRLAVEGVVIVLSILLAFAIDAGWDARQASEGQAAFAATLADESGQALDAMNQAIGVHTTAMCRVEDWRREGLHDSGRRGGVDVLRAQAVG